MMNREQESTYGGFAMGMLIGAVAGAGLALLFAPKPGAQLRGEIGDSMSSLRDAAARRLREVANRASAEAGELQSAMGRVAEHARPNGRSNL